MIYLFDRAKKLQKIIPRKHLTDAKQTVVRNGLYQLSVTAPLFYETSKGTKYNHQKSIEKAWFAGHFDTDNRFQLYKIHTRNITADKSGEFILFDSVHIFFDEAKAMGNIHDRRFRDSEAKPAADAAFNLIGWTVTDYDVTDRHDINFYRASVTDAWNDLISTFNVEFDYELQFDGRKIISKNIIMKNKLGRWTGQRHAYGTNLLSLTQEQREGDIYTAAVGRGRGEEVGDGFGPRLEFGDIAWSKDGVEKPVGQNYIEIPSATQMYGYLEDGVIKPRIASEVVFEDVEDKLLLADSTYQWLLENCIPKATWKTEVSRFGHLNLGDGVGILYKDADIIKRARVEKIEHNLLDPKLSKLTLGDYHYFNQDKRQQRIDSTINRIRREANSRITQMKNEYTAWFDAQTLAIKNAHEQAVIDANANIQAAEERMEALITTTRTDWTDTFEAEVAEIYRKADEDYNRIETDINATIDATREEMEMEFNESVQNTRTYAEQQAAERADAVQSNLESATSSHQGMIDDLQSSVLDIDDFLGSDRNVGLNEMLYNERIHMEERINSINTWHYNLLRETQSLDDEHWQALGGTLEFGDSGERYFKSSSSELVLRALESKESFLFEAGETYTLTFQVQTYGHRRMDNIFIISTDSEIFPSNFDLDSNADIQTANVIYFGGEYRTYFITFTMPFDVYGKIRIGGDYRNNELGAREYRIKKPYLTQSDNKQWLHNPEDSLQNLEEVTRRVTLLEDGREEFITRTQYDYETGEIEGTIRNILETVDGRESIIQNHEDWINTNGASVIESAEGFQSKAWLADIHNPNLFSFTDVAELSHRIKWDGRLTSITGDAYNEFARFRNTSVNSNIGAISPNLEIIEGETYTLTWIAFIYDDSLNHFDYCYIMTPDGNAGISPLSNRPKRTLIPTPVGSYGGNPLYKYELTFTAPIGHGKASVMIGATAKADGVDASFAFKEPKLEPGDRATPYHNAYSMFNQRADSIALQVDDQESRIANFTVDLDGIAGTVADIEGDHIKQSSLEITPDYAQIGSMRIDGDTVGSLLRVSPSGIDAVAEAMRLSGDLLVDGDVEAITGDFIEGNFARLWAAEFEAITITGEHIETNTITAQHLTGADAILNYLMARQIFSEEVTSLVGNFVDVNAGNIVTSGLSANVILSSHINSSNALIDKLFSNSARIDTLISKTHFVNEIKATSIDAVYADLRSVNSEIMDTNILKADWIQGGNALLDKVFANTAMFERMMAKSGFVSTMSAITLDLHELTIWRPDGMAFVQNGMERFGHPVPLTIDIDDDVTYNNKYFETNSRGAQQVAVATGDHAGRYYNLVVGVGMRSDSSYTSTTAAVLIRPQNVPSGLNWNNHIETRTVRRDEGMQYFTINYPMGRPTYQAMSFTIELYRIGTNVTAPVQLRTRRSWVSA